MSLPFRISLVLLALAFWLPGPAIAESSAQEALQVPLSLRPLIQRSGYIFAGTVLAVEHVVPLPNEMPIVRVTFHIDEAIRGVQQGQTLTIREWARLWNSSEQYHRGEQVLLFLYPISKLGLTSPVGGRSGRFQLTPGGGISGQESRFVIRRNKSSPGEDASAERHLPTRVFLQALRRAAQE
jgi:hypothetical protein